MNLITQKMGLHEWSYSNDYNPAKRAKMKHVDLAERFAKLALEVELGFDPEQTAREVERCLNCDMQTVFTRREVHRVRRLHRRLPDALPDHRARRRGGRAAQAADRRRRQHRRRTLYVSGALPQTGRVMVKDEDVCVHCGLCAERCPTAAWDMQKFELQIPHAGNAVQRQHDRTADASLDARLTQLRASGRQQAARNSQPTCASTTSRSSSRTSTAPARPAPTAC